MSEYKLKITHLYPDLLNLYGDKGNIECMKKRLLWRGIDVEVCQCTIDNPEINLDNTDILVLGGGTDRETELVRKDLMKIKDKIAVFVENGGTVLATCDGFELLGKYTKRGDVETECLGILDIHTVFPENNSRFIGNVVIKCKDIETPVVGFENHGGRVDIGSHTPFGTVLKGYGNDGESGYEGVIYKNVYATYLHGPLLPKNPQLCDRILKGALKNRYPDFTELAPLDDQLENKANNYMASKFL